MKYINQGELAVYLTMYSHLVCNKVFHVGELASRMAICCMNYPYIGWKVVVQLWIKGLYENMPSCISLKLAVLSYSTNLFQLIVYNPMEKKTATKMGYKK
jgi:hypothetical protein